MDATEEQNDDAHQRVETPINIYKYRVSNYVFRQINLGIINCCVVSSLWLVQLASQSLL